MLVIEEIPNVNQNKQGKVLTMLNPRHPKTNCQVAFFCFRSRPYKETLKESNEGEIRPFQLSPSTGKTTRLYNNKAEKSKRASRVHLHFPTVSS